MVGGARDLGAIPRWTTLLLAVLQPPPFLRGGGLIRIPAAEAACPCTTDDDQPACPCAPVTGLRVPFRSRRRAGRLPRLRGAHAGGGRVQKKSRTAPGTTARCPHLGARPSVAYVPSVASNSV